MKLNLDQLENRLQALIEVRLTNYLPGKNKEGHIAQQLAAVMHANLTEKDGAKLAPNVYTLVAHPDLIGEWESDSQMVETFKEILDMIASEADFKFAGPPTITLAPDAALTSDEVHIVASQRVETVAETQGMEVSEDGNKEEDEENIPENAFLIVHGTKVFPLNNSVINIGRRVENELTIDDPRVSRNHAQLRAIKGRFVIFDLNSTGGTYVNSQRAHQSVLYPGDVISLAGVPLIFGQDNPPMRADLSQTSPFTVPATGRLASTPRKTAKFGKPPKR